MKLIEAKEISEKINEPISRVNNAKKLLGIKPEGYFHKENGRLNGTYKSDVAGKIKEFYKRIEEKRKNI